MESAMICYKFASRSRPAKFFDTIHNINAQAVHRRYFILASLDQDDPTMNKEDVRGWIHMHPEIIAYYGVSGSKIAAINRDMEKAPHWNILINVSDDMRFIVKGFDQEIISHFQEYFPDGDGVLHYPDGNEPGTRVMTMTIAGRKYYERFGYIYPPEYKSLWCDVEATEVAQRLGKWKYINQQLFDHQHPAHNKAPMDPQYQVTESHFYADFAIYERRKAVNFGLK